MKHLPIVALAYLLALPTTQVQADNITPAVDKDSIVLSYTADEVVVQAFKSNNNLEQLPVSASLLTNTTIKDRNITNIKEISSVVPNLFMPDYGTKMTSPIYIRGIGSRTDEPSVGLYVDGVPYFQKSTFDLGLNDVDRIEVLKGPQGTIYGRNTMGGIINIFTKSPFKYRGTNVQLSAANYNTYNVAASHFGNLKNIFGYSVSANYLHKGGFFNNLYTGKKADPMDAISGRVRLSWRLRPELFIHLTSAYEYFDQKGYAYGQYDPKTHQVANVNYDSPSYYRRNMTTNGLNIQYNTDKIRFNSQTSYQYFDGRQLIDQDFTPADMIFVNFGHRQNMISQEFNIKSAGSRKYEWITGIFGFYDGYKTNNDIRQKTDRPQKVRSHTYQHISTPSKGVAVYHQSTINDILAKGLSATLGLRYDWEEDRSHVVVDKKDKDKPIVNKQNTRDKAVFSQLQPKAALKYTFTNDEIVYASVTRGYKTGGFNNTADDPKLHSYKPEHSWSYEIGAKASCLNKLIYTDLSLFYIQWQNQQISVYEMGSHGYVIRNAGRTTSKGLELTVHINPLKNLSIDLGYGYTHAQFKKYQYNDTVSYKGNYVPMAPRNTFSAAASYSIHLKNNPILDKIMLNSQVTAQGRIYWREDNQTSQPFYATWDAQATFEKKMISVDLWAKNLTSTKYVAYFFKGMAGNFGQRGKPFTCGINVNFKF